MKRPESIIPGIIPAIKSRPILSSVRIAYITNPAEGGINIPSVPPAAIDPVASMSW